MKKLISVIPIAILICILLSSELAYALTDKKPQEFNYCCIVVFPHGTWIYDCWLCGFDEQPYIDQYNNLRPSFNYVGFDTINECYTYYNDNRYNLGSHNGYTSGFIEIISVKGSVNINDYSGIYYDSWEDYQNAINPPSPTPEPTSAPAWYQGMWDTLKEELGNPAFWFGDWFIDIIDQVFGNDENPSQGPSRLSDSTHIQQVTPAPTPSPIPYSTITVPRTDIITGTTVYETNYYYTNPSGTPIVATSPPTNTTTNNNNGGGSGNSQDYNPIDPYSIPQTTWFTSAEIGDSTYDGIDSIMQGFDSIDTIGDDYTEGMSAAEDSMGLLPTSWLLLIGVAAAIPLIAGIISRFLS